MSGTLALAAGCAHPVSVGAPRPGPPLLSPPSNGMPPAPPVSFDSTWVLDVLSVSGTKTQRKIGQVERHELTVPGGRLAVTFKWDQPVLTADSLVVQPGTLVPVSERYAYRGTLYTYRYDGPHVVGTIQHADSTPKALDMTFDQPVFAFNEIELLVRAAPRWIGYHAVMPIFSEVDHALEVDTIDVVSGARLATGDSLIKVRFADPVITTLYTVRASTYRVEYSETTNRKSHAILRYLPVIRKP
jgi:hypothetical protein